MKILEEFRLRHGAILHGAILAGRVVQSPMVTRGSTKEGFVKKKTLFIMEHDQK